MESWHELQGLARRGNVVAEEMVAQIKASAATELDRARELWRLHLGGLPEDVAEVHKEMLAAGFEERHARRSVALGPLPYPKDEEMARAQQLEAAADEQRDRDFLRWANPYGDQSDAGSEGGAKPAESSTSSLAVVPVQPAVEDSPPQPSTAAASLTEIDSYKGDDGKVKLVRKEGDVYYMQEQPPHVVFTETMACDTHAKKFWVVVVGQVAVMILAGVGAGVVGVAPALGCAAGLALGRVGVLPTLEVIDMVGNLGPLEDPLAAGALDDDE